MITDVEDFFARGCGRCPRFATSDCATAIWSSGLVHLRRICLGAGLEETAKWGHPCYMHGGRNIAIIGAFRDDFRLTFFNAALLSDPAGILERQGAASRHPDTIRFAAEADVAAKEVAILACLTEAMGHAAAGRKSPKEEREIALPDELIEALDCDPVLAEAFHALTPGRRRSYAINLAAAKTTGTRRARIARFRDRIIAGKGATER
ncbi:MAG: YdeI/OmpD-associated family protein [Hyphomicrobiaceae bacterium]